MPWRASKSQRRKLLILSRLALLGFLPRLPLNIRQTRIPALLVQCRTISPLLLKAREKRTAPCRNYPLTKDTKSCFVIKPPVYLSVLFCVFFSSAFLSNAIYSGKTWNGIKGKTGRPPFSTSFIADNMRSDILFLAIESGVTVSGCPTTWYHLYLYFINFSIASFFAFSCSDGGYARSYQLSIQWITLSLDNPHCSNQNFSV